MSSSRYNKKANGNWVSRKPKGEKAPIGHPWRGADYKVKSKLNRIWTDLITPENDSVQKTK